LRTISGTAVWWKAQTDPTLVFGIIDLRLNML
jgi:hypothetical protein